MSVWTDMMDRGTGDLKKKEDIETYGPYVTKAEIDKLVQPIIFIGTVDKKGFPKGFVPQIGQMVCINEDCQFGKKGEVMIYTGNDWVNLTVDQTTSVNSYLHI